MRNLLFFALVLAFCSVFAKGQAAQTVRSDADIEKLLPRLSNWGRWGKDDQLGLQ